MSCDALVTGALYLYTSFTFNVTCCLHLCVCIVHTSYMLYHCLQAVNSSHNIYLCDLHILILILIFILSRCTTSFYICIHFILFDILFIYIVFYSHVLTFALFMSLTSTLFFSVLIHLWDCFIHIVWALLEGARTRISLPTTAPVRLSRKKDLNLNYWKCIRHLLLWYHCAVT